MADYNLGTARGRIEIDASGVGRGLKDANDQLGQIETRAKNSGTQMILAGGAMLTAAGTIAGGFAYAINTAADFEQRLSAVKAVSGATAEEMELLSDKALQLGADTAFSASESASAIEELVKAGLSVEDVLNGAADATVNLAAAGEIDLVSAATIASNAMNAFGLSAEELPKVADLIAGAANASAIDVGEFGMSMQQSAAVANLAGLSFDDLAVAIAAMGNAGIRGSDAGTSLKTFLQNLQPVTEKQIDLFKELGIVTADGTNQFYDQAGSLKPLSEVADVLASSLDGMTDAQKQMALETMFGSDAIRAAAVIADTGAEGFDELAAAMGKVSAEEVAETRLDNLKGSMEQLSGAAETLLIKIGQPLAESFRVWVDRLTEAVNWVSNLDEDSLGLLVTIAKMVTAFLGSVGSILVVVGSIQKLRVALTTLGLAMRANPLGAFLTLLVGIGAALYTLYTSNETFRKAVDRLFASIRDVAMPIIEKVTLGFQALIAAFNDGDVTSDGFVGQMERIGVVARQVFENVSAFIQDILIPAIQDFADFIQDEVIPAIQSMAEFFMDEVVPVLIDVGEWFAWLAGEIIERAGSAFSWLEEHVFPVIVALAELVAAIVDRITGEIDRVGKVVRRMAPLWGLIGNAAKAAFGIVVNIIKTTISVVTTIWKNFGDNLFRIIDFAWDTITRVVEVALKFIKGVIQVITGIISGDWSKAWEGIKNILAAVWDGIVLVVRTAIDAVKIIIQNAIDAIITAWQVAWTVVKNAFSTAWNLLKSIVSGGVNAIIGFITGIPGRISGFVSGMWKGFTGAAKSAVDTVFGFFSGLPGRIRGIIGSIGEAAKSVGSSIINKIGEGISNISSFIGSVASALWNGIKNWLNTNVFDPIRNYSVKIDPPGPGVLYEGRPFGSFPRLHEGGMVPGTGEQMTILLGGEAVLSRSQVAALKGLMQMIGLSGRSVALAGAGGGGAGVTQINFNFPGVKTAADAEQVERALESSDVVSRLASAVRVGKR